MVRNGTGGRRHLISPTDDPSPADVRRVVRAEMRLRRRSLGGARRRLATRAIVRHFLALPAYRAAARLALYWPADGEPDVRELATHARARGKRVYLPVIGRAGTLAFAAWPRDASLKPNRYGIPEPLGTRRVTTRELQLIVVPLVAFDAAGNRLGMGGGYYDRALAGRRRNTFLAGAAFSLQGVARLPAQPWDVPLDLVITERGRRATRKRQGEPGTNTCKGVPR